MVYSGGRGTICGVLLYVREDQGLSRRTSSARNVCDMKWDYSSQPQSVCLSGDSLDGSCRICGLESSFVEVTAQNIGSCGRRALEENACSIFDDSQLNTQPSFCTEIDYNCILDNRMVSFAQHLTIFCTLALFSCWVAFFAKAGGSFLVCFEPFQSS
eukprot:756218-Hanusia_phi.AAC.1